MDVELQMLKHLARDAQPTVSVIDEYCQGYKDLFPEVRSYECFKYLGLAEKRRKARTGGRRRQEKMNQVQGMGVK
uniref:Transposase for insertion sequence element IS701 n=1 Tax=Planktothrix pseudagardhii TaxID=132604 RepID=A0A9W4CLU9_9CYAN|nr:putative transposase for insertion sequence element IS701 [Planktothrix pseudagardhii]